MIRLRSQFLEKSNIVSELDENGRFTYASSHLTGIFDADQNDFFGKKFTDFLCINNSKESLAEDELFDDLAQGMGVQKRLNFVCNGISKWFNTTLITHFFEPEIKGYLLIQQHIDTERLLQNESERLSMIVRDTSFAVLVTDPQEKIQWANHSFEKLSGYTVSEVVGLNPRIFQGIETDPATRQEMRNKLNKQQPFSCEILNYSKNGRKYWVNIDCQPLYQGRDLIGFFSIQYDITARKEFETALIESEARFRSMADSAPVLIWKAGTDKLCNFFNKVWLEFTGKTPEQEMGYGWLEGVCEKDRERCKEIYIEAFDRREKFSMEYRLQRHDGQMRWLLDQGNPLFNGNHEFIGYIGSCVDIHDRKMAEISVKKQNEQLKEIARLHSHDVRRPLATLIGLVSLIDSTTLSTENRELFNMMLGTAEELDIVIHKIVGQTQIDLKANNDSNNIA